MGACSRSALPADAPALRFTRRPGVPAHASPPPGLSAPRLGFETQASHWSLSCLCVKRVDPDQGWCGCLSDEHSGGPAGVPEAGALPQHGRALAGVCVTLQQRVQCVLWSPLHTSLRSAHVMAPVQEELPSGPGEAARESPRALEVTEPLAGAWGQGRLCGKRRRY